MNNRHILPFQGWRLVLFQAVVVFSLIVLTLRTAELQFGRGEQFVRDAEENRLQLVLIAAPRGAIYDRNHVPLAKNDPAYSVQIVPAELPDDPQDVLDLYNRLSALVDVPATRAAADAAGRVNERSLDELVREGEGIAPYSPVVVAQDIPRNAAFQIWDQAQLLPGVSAGGVGARISERTVTAHIVGYLPIGPTRKSACARWGITRDSTGWLCRRRGVFRDGDGRAARHADLWSMWRDARPTGGREKFRLGSASSDDRCRTAGGGPGSAHQTDQYCECHRAAPCDSAGCRDAMRPRNGEVLALVSWPSYDNSRFARTIDGE